MENDGAVVKGGSFSDVGTGTTTTEYSGVTVNITLNISVDSEIKEEAEMQLDNGSAKCLSEYKVTISHLVADAGVLGELLNQTDTMRNYNYFASEKGTTYATVELDSLNNFNNVVYLKEL